MNLPRRLVAALAGEKAYAAGLFANAVAATAVGVGERKRDVAAAGAVGDPHSKLVGDVRLGVNLVKKPDPTSYQSGEHRVPSPRSGRDASRHDVSRV